MALPEKHRRGVAPRRIKNSGFCRFLLPYFVPGCHTFGFKIATAAMRPRNGTKMVGFAIKPTIFISEMFEIRLAGTPCFVPGYHTFGLKIATAALRPRNDTGSERVYLENRGFGSYIVCFRPGYLFSSRLSCKKPPCGRKPVRTAVLVYGAPCGNAPSGGCAGCSLFVKITAGWRNA